MSGDEYDPITDADRWRRIAGLVRREAAWRRAAQPAVEEKEAEADGGRKSGRTKRRRNKPLLAAVRRLEQADPPMTRSEIITKLLPRYGNKYDPNAGGEYRRARNALAARIRRAEKAAGESDDV